jgi:hypothetical protein
MRRILGAVVMTLAVVACSAAEGQRVDDDGRRGAPANEAGRGSTIVPDVRTVPEDQAIDMLADAGLVPGELTERYNDHVGRGRVIRTQPDAGERVEVDTVVDYTVSLGPEDGPPPTPSRQGLVPVATTDSTSAPTRRSTAAPTARRTPRPTQISVRDFGFGDAFEGSEGSVRLTGRGTRHRTTDHIAWRIGLPTTDPSTALVMTVTRDSDGEVVARVEKTTEGRRVVYGRLPRLSRAGTYTVRLYADGERIDTARLTVNAPATPRPTAKPTRRPRPRRNCDPSYPTVCIPPWPPDLDCGDVPYRRFRVEGSDPHRFDADNDGIGCESG